MQLVYVPCPDRETAMDLGEAAVEAELAGCANLHPVTSIYRWQGALQQDEEVVLLCKTTADAVDDLRGFLADRHPYDVPCIATLDATVDEDYLAWLRGCCG